MSVFYQLNQTGTNEQKLPSTWNVGKLPWSPTVSGDVVLESVGMLELENGGLFYLYALESVAEKSECRVIIYR